MAMTCNQGKRTLPFLTSCSGRHGYVPRSRGDMQRPYGPASFTFTYKLRTHTNFKTFVVFDDEQDKLHLTQSVKFEDETSSNFASQVSLWDITQPSGSPRFHPCHKQSLALQGGENTTS
ncbi:hypothetical protein E2C01_036665 [Portunus trituberculatus]|uniref:Uncharacterized protein n=1 Tax=Portunus trituberculatus TaxID=210409 RepID=A0A5B7F639_PORTR|nr:hypothetical protein [Portunus trituberculatus]